MNTRHIQRALLVGVVAASAAVPVANAANRTVQIDGRLVAPTQVSEAQVAAGHAASARLVQIGGRLVEPSQLSRWQAGAGRSSGVSGTSADPSSGIVSAITLLAAAAATALLAASAVLMRRRTLVSRAT
jgi:hypothetical protein